MRVYGKRWSNWISSIFRRVVISLYQRNSSFLLILFQKEDLLLFLYCLTVSIPQFLCDFDVITVIISSTFPVSRYRMSCHFYAEFVVCVCRDGVGDMIVMCFTMWADSCLY